MVLGMGAFTGQGWALTLKDFLISNIMIIIGIGGATLSSLFAYTMGLKRLYGYGMLTLVLFFTGYFLAIPFEYFVVTIGLVIIISGFVLLMRFIRKYPLAQGDTNNAESF